MMQQRRRPPSVASAAGSKPPPARRASAPLSLAGLLISVFVVATFLYTDQGPASAGAGEVDQDLVLQLQEAAHREVNARARQQQQLELQRRHPPPGAPGAGGGGGGGGNTTTTTSSSSSTTTTTTTTTREREYCDLYQGRWVFDAAGEQAPLYREAECEFLTEQVTCMRNGRRDDSYQKWRWQPGGCDLPRFNASLLLERLRNKRLMFVGDSLNRNQWESMVCLVQSAIPSGAGKKTLAKFVNNGSLNVFTAHDYNATVEFYWAPFLVQSNSDDPQVHSVADRVIAWRAIAHHARHWRKAHYLIFNTYIWWLNTLEMKVLKKPAPPAIAIPGGAGRSRRRHHQQQSQQQLQWSGKYALVDRPVAYREVPKTWAKWVDRHVDPAQTQVFFMAMSPNHIMPWAWGNPGGIKCAMETQPIPDMEEEESSGGGGNGTARRRRLEIGTDWQLHGVARGVLARYLRRVAVQFVDITALSELRKDAHTSVHTLRQGRLLTPDQQADPATYADCIHWCLPGLPDTWNHFLYAHILSSSSHRHRAPT